MPETVLFNLNGLSDERKGGTLFQEPINHVSLLL